MVGMGEVEGVASAWGGGVDGTSVGGALTSARPAASAGESGATDIRQSIHGQCMYNTVRSRVSAHGRLKFTGQKTGMSTYKEKPFVL